MDNQEQEKERVTIWIRKSVRKGAEHVAIDKDTSLSGLVDKLLEREIREAAPEYSVSKPPRQKQPA